MFCTACKMTLIGVEMTKNSMDLLLFSSKSALGKATSMLSKIDIEEKCPPICLNSDKLQDHYLPASLILQHSLVAPMRTLVWYGTDWYWLID